MVQPPLDRTSSSSGFSLFPLGTKSAGQVNPDICFGWGKVDVRIWTHKIDGLTESDFILAAKIDILPGNLKSE